MIALQSFEKHLRCLNDFCLMDDIFFFRCAKDHPELVQLMLRIILKEDIDILTMKLQEEMRHFFHHSFIMDCLVKINHDRIVNVEIQQYDAGAHPKRARAYASALDVEWMEKGMDYRDLNESIVIFITKHDVLGKGLPIYHIDRTIDECNEPFHDGSHIIYVNCAIQDGSPLGLFNHDMLCTDPDQMHYEIMAERARYFKRTKRGEKEMCLAMENWKKEIIAESLEIGREEGISKGKIEKQIAIARALISEGSLSLETIAKVTELSMEEILSFKQIVVN